MKIGVFGGSFDPVHSEHVALCRAAVESLSLDRLFIVPAATPPHKKGKALSDGQVRLKMCKLAFSDVPKAEVSDFELLSGGTSYTYLTVEYFRSKFPDADLYFLVGTDMLRDFPTWKYPLRILENCTLAVCARAEEKGWAEREREAFRKQVRSEKPFVVIDYLGKAVSSTRIRVLAAAGEDVSAYLPKSVEEVLEREKSYEIPNAKEALDLEKPSRKEHSLRVAFFAAEHAKVAGVEEQKAVCAALFHDCAKNLEPDNPLLSGFVCPSNVPKQVWHQFAGAYLAERVFGLTDEDVLNAVRYHTSGRENMSKLEKLLFLADMLEEGRKYEGVEALRAAFEQEGLDGGMEAALKQTLAFLREQGGEIYPLTQKAYEYIKTERRKQL